ncbi:hypothetical protein BP5796_12635 [Coleophoma crateriformis]|uniref:Rieske domain-containing protein n=1 Tax=Coleophoma crateriformis TaxID=565419 RepID=A0A3D8Q8S2_9HELO|nr:hypothetical protein BP5796_12635 [Coleophoma crateriformis]
MFGLTAAAPPVFVCTFVALLVSLFLNIWLLINNFKFALNDLDAGPATAATNDGLIKRSELPQGWWTDSMLFQAERRAIFSKTWICVSHRSRFVKPGDYVSHEIAGFRFFLILGKDNTVRAFHNVCRHRAFPVTEKASGSSTILGCKYHGWCYNTQGQLTKAPHFDDVSGFDRSQNSLFEIHTKVNEYGFLQINLDGSKEAGESQLPDTKKIGKPAGINYGSQFLHSWELKGNFNWKLTVNDEYQNGNKTSKAASGAFRVFHTQDLTPADQLYFFPLTTVYTKSGSTLWYQLTYSPDSPQQTNVRCDVYSARKSDAAVFEGTIKDNLEAEIKAKIQKYEATYGTLTSSNCNPSDSSYDQARIADAVTAHLEQEKIEGREIKPATVQQCRSEAFTKAEKLCQALECTSDTLAW